MKKTLFLSIGTLFILTACGGKTTETANDTTATPATVNQDSINASAAEAAQAAEAAEAARQDSLAMVEAENAFNNAVTLTAGNSNFSFADESSQGMAVTKVTLTNNTPIDLEPKDYTIVYTYPSEITRYGELEEVEASGVATGPLLEANKSTEYTIKQGDATGKIKSPKVKLNITKEAYMAKIANK